eukprot:11191798-Lingulodinium_polyedra.AAC.1
MARVRTTRALRFVVARLAGHQGASPNPEGLEAYRVKARPLRIARRVLGARQQLAAARNARAGKMAKRVA